MYIDLQQATPAEAYYQMIQTLVPRPIAWALSENADGTLNLAPFSYFTAVCSDPPLLMLSVGKQPGGGPKDTRVNIEQRGHFVVHIAHRELLEAVNASAASLPPGHSEVIELGLETVDFEDFSLPRLSAARVAFACECHAVQEIGNQQQALVFGRIQSIYADDAVLWVDQRGRTRVDSGLLDPVARLGADQYLVGGQVLTLKRPG